MKKRNKTNIYIVMALALFIGFGATQAFATPGDTISPLIHKGAGAQIVVDMVLGASSATSALLDINEFGKNSVFDGLNGLALDDQAFMTILGNSWLQDMVFVGKNRVDPFLFSIGATFPDPILDPILTNTKSAADMVLWTTPYTAGTSVLQKMNIFGGIVSTDMNTAAGNVSGTAQVCIDSVGIIIMCP